MNKKIRNDIAITGEINREGIYELKPEENLSDLINLAGNLKITAYLKRSQIDRVVPFEDRNKVGMDRMYVDVNLEETFNSNKDFSMNDGDRINIFSVLDVRQNVYVQSMLALSAASYFKMRNKKMPRLVGQQVGFKISTDFNREHVHESFILSDIGKF